MSFGAGVGNSGETGDSRVVPLFSPVKLASNPRSPLFQYVTFRSNMAANETCSRWCPAEKMERVVGVA